MLNHLEYLTFNPLKITFGFYYRIFPTLRGSDTMQLNLISVIFFL